MLGNKVSCRGRFAAFVVKRCTYQKNYSISKVVGMALNLVWFSRTFRSCHEPLIVPIFMSQHSTSPPKTRLDLLILTQKTSFYQGKRPFAEIFSKSKKGLEDVGRVPVTSYFRDFPFFHRGTTVTTQGKHCNVPLQRGHNLS